MISVIVVSSPTAFAQQTSGEFKIWQLRKTIATAGADVPEPIMSQIEDIVMENEHLYEVRIGGFTLAETKEGKEKRSEIQALLFPYAKKAERNLQTVPKSKFIQIPNLTANQKAQHVANLYRLEFVQYGEPLSIYDVEQLETITREYLERINEHLSLVEPLESANKTTPEYVFLWEQLLSLQQSRKDVLRPYREAYNAKQIERVRAISSLMASPKTLTIEEKVEQRYRFMVDPFSRYNISVSQADELTIKRLIKEEVELMTERRRLEEFKNNKIINETENRNLIDRQLKVSLSIAKIIRPYLRRREALIIRTGYE